MLWAIDHENLALYDKKQMLLLSMTAVQESSLTTISTTIGTYIKKDSVSALDKSSKSIFCYLYNNEQADCKFEKTELGPISYNVY